MIGQGWQPSAALDTLRLRARVIAEIRSHFAACDVLEITTPLMMPYGTTDPSLVSFQTSPLNDPPNSLGGFLQTSPELAMKRLLASGSGDIFQLGPAFRAEQAGRFHLPEFTLLEWYRLDFDHHRLMDDVEDLVRRILTTLRFERCSYAQLFLHYLGIEPHLASSEELALCASQAGIELGNFRGDRSVTLDALFACALDRSAQPSTGLFVYDFPVEQAAYARLAAGPPPVAERFELAVNGVEIANGYHELTDAAEQMSRHRRENDARRRHNLPTVEVDSLFIAALEHGLPDCAGVAVGVDRLVMLRSNLTDIVQVNSFCPYVTPDK